MTWVYLGKVNCKLDLCSRNNIFLPSFVKKFEKSLGKMTKKSHGTNAMSLLNEIHDWKLPK